VTRKPDAYVRNIRDSMALLDEWAAEGFDTFCNDAKTNKAIVRALHEVTESVQRLEKLWGKRYPELPWKQVISFRNVVVHDYLGLDLQQVWTIVTKHLPELKPHIQRMLADLPPERPHS